MWFEVELLDNIEGLKALLEQILDKTPGLISLWRSLSICMGYLHTYTGMLYCSNTARTVLTFNTIQYLKLNCDTSSLSHIILIGGVRYTIRGCKTVTHSMALNSNQYIYSNLSKNGDNR